MHLYICVYIRHNMQHICNICSQLYSYLELARVLELPHHAEAHLLWKSSLLQGTACIIIHA